MLHFEKKNSVLFPADKALRCPGNVFSLVPLGPAWDIQGEGLTTGLTKEKGFKQ